MKLYKKLILMLCCFVMLINVSYVVNAEDSEFIDGYTYYDNKEEETGNLILVKEDYVSPVVPMVSSSTYTNIYSLYDGTSLVAKYSVTIGFNYSVPTTSGHIAQIYSCTVSLVYQDSGASYYIDVSGATKTITNGAAATAHIEIPTYYRSTGARHGTCVVQEVCYADGSHS